MFGSISRKIREGKFVEPKVEPYVVVLSPSKKSRTVIAKEDEIPDNIRKEFEKDFADFDFGDLSEEAQQQQEIEVEQLENLEDSITVKEFLKDFDRVQDEDITDEGCPIKVKTL